MSNRGKIAKNTALLYFRMLLTMVVSLYTVRVVLDVLGITDYGIYNVVGGIVTMFAFVSGTLASASQRFFSFELGRENYPELKRVFNMTVTIYIILAVLIVILAETVGLWLLNTKIKIPVGRITAANWVYQTSVFSLMFTMLTIPYNALIIARERMDIYAYVSIVEVLLKLLVAYLLIAFSSDKLILYSILSLAITFTITLIYRIYCRKKFEESKYSFSWEKELFRKIIGFSSWNLFGATAVMFNNQGLNVLLNMFFGPLVNTARAVAFQVNSNVNMFVQNFMTATRPQIIKYYASGERTQMLKLVYQSSKFSCLLLLLLSVPILIDTQYIFTLWLTRVPEYVVVFTRLILVTAIIDSLSYPLMTAAQATGNIKKYQAVVGGVMLLNLPISYILLKLGYQPQVVFYATIFNSLACLYLRLIMLKKIAGLSISDYLLTVILPIVIVIVPIFSIPFLIPFQLKESFLRFVIISVSSITVSFVSMYALALTKSERGYLKDIFKKAKKKIYGKENSI